MVNSCTEPLLAIVLFTYLNYSFNFFAGRFQAAVTSFQGKIWAVGGCDGWNPLNSVEIYDPSTNSWKIGPALTSPRRGSGLAVRNGKHFIYASIDSNKDPSCYQNFSLHRK